MAGQLGLEGMSNEDIAQMHKEWDEEADHMQLAIAKRARWMQRDDPWRLAVWKLLATVGFGYEDAFRDGWVEGMGEGRMAEAKRLGVLCDRLDIPCYFGRGKTGVKV